MCFYFFTFFFCCLTSRTSFPVIKAKGCLATSLVLTVRGDVPLADCLAGPTPSQRSAVNAVPTEDARCACMTAHAFLCSAVHFCVCEHGARRRKRPCAAAQRWPWSVPLRFTHKRRVSCVVLCAFQVPSQPRIRVRPRCQRRLGCDYFSAAVL